MRSVSIQGISGSGKTTLGAALAARLGVAHLETDALVHGPGWTETPDDELRAAIEAFMGGGGWVIDSDYRRKLGTLVLERADTVVWLDLPLHVCLRRLWGRTVPRIRERQELWNGNRRVVAGGVLGLGLALRLRGAQARLAAPHPAGAARPAGAGAPQGGAPAVAGGGGALAGNRHGRGAARRRLNHRGLRASIP